MSSKKFPVLLTKMEVNSNLLPVANISSSSSWWERQLIYMQSELDMICITEMLIWYVWN